MTTPRQCSSCGNVVDVRLPVCRHCGQPVFTADELRRIRHEAALKQEHQRKKIALLVGAGVVVAIVLGLAGSRKSEPSCMERGREFYKELDAYPTMHNGKDAEEYIYQQCSNAKDSDTLFRYNDK